MVLKLPILSEKVPKKFPKKSSGDLGSALLPLKEKEALPWNKRLAPEKPYLPLLRRFGMKRGIWNLWLKIPEILQRLKALNMNWKKACNY